MIGGGIAFDAALSLAVVTLLPPIQPVPLTAVSHGPIVAFVTSAALFLTSSDSFLAFFSVSSLSRIVHEEYVVDLVVLVDLVDNDPWLFDPDLDP